MKKKVLKTTNILLTGAIAALGFGACSEPLLSWALYAHTISYSGLVAVQRSRIVTPHVSPKQTLPSKRTAACSRSRARELESQVLRPPHSLAVLPCLNPGPEA